MKWMIENHLQRHWQHASKDNTAIAWAYLVGWLQGYFVGAADDDAEVLFLIGVAFERQQMAGKEARL